MTDSLVKLDGLGVTFGRGRGRTSVVRGVSFEIGKAETLGLIGESGSGKTTIGRAVIGLAPVSSGRVCFEGDDLGAPGARKKHLGQIQMVFQDPYSSLNPALSVRDIVAEPLRVLGASRTHAEAEAENMLERVQMPRSAGELYPAQFSGGQRQRIAIARALITRPKLVICDEATSALDLSVQAQVLRLLQDLQSEFGQSYLFIGHNIDVVRKISHRIAVLNRGELVEMGAASQLVAAPQDAYTRRLILSSLSPDPEIQAQRRAKRAAARTARERTQGIR